MSSVKYLLVMLFSIALAACGGGGGGGSSVTAPGAPTTVTASPGNTLATVSFTAPANNGGAAITGYTVTSSPGNISGTGTTSPISVTGLTNSTAYTFTVVATNSAGNSAASTASNSVMPSAIAIAPSAPTSVTATAGNNTATVTFTASASNGGAAITGYTVTSSPAVGTDSNAGTTGLTHTITGLTNNTAYTFTVVATNSAGSSPASTASNSVTPTAAPTVPGVPTAVTATAGNASATVGFTAPANTGGAAITGYTITSSPAGGTDSNAATTGLTHTITGLSNGTAYTFTVVAANSVGSSPASSASNSVTPVTVPGAPTAVTGTVGNAQVTVSFTAPAITGGAIITGYTVTSSPGAITATGTASPITVTGLTNNLAYTFTVVATNSAGSSTASTPSPAVTPITGYTVPGVPTNVAATAGNTLATVTFTASASNGGTAITGYTVTSHPAGGVDSNAGTTGLTHTITGLTNGVAYTFTVVATNSVGNSAASTASNSATPALAPVSGAVTGAWPTGVTISVSGGTTSTQTDSNGNYSFNLSPGGYTLTPSLPGYTFSPTNIPVTVPAGSSTAITGNNFVSSSAVTSYSVSGTLTNNSTATGGGTIRVFNSGCTSYNNCQIVAAAHFGSLAVNGTANYTIRGLQPGNYDVKAGIGVVSSGWPNASNPSSGLIAFTIGSANVTSVNVSMADVTAPTPTAPTGLSVSPGNTAAFIQYNPFTNANGAETATSYKIYWGTDVNATNGSGSPVTFAAQGLNQTMYFLKGLSNGAMNFKMTALVGSTESAPTAVVAATIGTPAGNTVSGTVTCTACPALSASTPMIVGLYDQTNGIPYFTIIASPTSSQAYTIAGVPSGTNYFPFAVIDMNNNGRVDVGDISNTNGNGSTSIAVSGNLSNANIALTYASATVDVSTGFWSNNGTSGSYNANVSLNDGTKRLVGATLYSGPKVPVPSDLSTYGNNWANVQITGTPSVGDSYQFLLTFSDGSTQNMTASVTGVLGVSNLAQSLAIVTNGTGGSSTTVPLFTWAAPATPPASFTYRVNLYGTNNSTNWNYPKDNGIPSTTSPLQVLYNADGKASGPLVSGAGNSYNWQVEVRDANRNSATMQAPIYTLP